MTYSEKLKDPRWQKMRLKILERDEFRCQDCWDEENTLHVHHNYYEKGRDPWEYDESSLKTLCDGCHDMEHDRKIAALESLIDSAKKYLLGWEIEQLCAFLDPRFKNLWGDHLQKFIRGLVSER